MSYGINHPIWRKEEQCIVRALISSLIFSLYFLRHRVADPAYDDKELYYYIKSIENRFGLSSVKRYEVFQKKAWACMLLSIGIRIVYLHSDGKDSNRTIIDRADKISVQNKPIFGTWISACICNCTHLFYLSAMVYYNCKKD